MTIEDALQMIEDDFLESDIKELSPDKRMAFYQTLKEFVRAKIQRSTFEPVGSNETKILIEYEHDKTTPHEGVPQSLDITKEN